MLYFGPMSALTLPVLSCSLDPRSRSRSLAFQSAEALRRAGHESQVVDLAEIRLPAFDNDEVFGSDAFQHLYRVVGAADGIVLSFPIYNWAPAATVKSLIEATGATGEDERVSAWFDKVVTFVCAAGLPHSYMATGSLAQSLMTDFKCVINPYVAYVSDRDWRGEVLEPDRVDRLNKTMTVHADLAELLAARHYKSSWEV